MRHGFGSQRWHVSQSVYAGQWEKDLMEGHGKLQTTTVSYEGEFVKGEQQGAGTQIWEASGDEYSGHFLQNRPHGKGLYKFPARGESYSGHLQDGEFEGEGVYSYVDGSTYSGQWRKGLQHGQGELSYSNGGTYKGQMVNNMFDGKGIFMEADGSTYIGSFKENTMVGEVKLLKPDGSIEGRVYTDTGEIASIQHLAEGAGQESFFIVGGQRFRAAPAGTQQPMNERPGVWKLLLAADLSPSKAEKDAAHVGVTMPRVASQ